MSDMPVYNLDCQKCQVQYKLDDVAFDKTCQNRHIFLFLCPKCGDYKGTAMANVPQEQWKEFVPADQLDDLLQKYAEAMKNH